MASLTAVRYAQEFHSFVGMIAFSKQNTDRIPTTISKILAAYRHQSGVKAVLTAYEKSRPGEANPYSISHKELQDSQTSERELGIWISNMTANPHFGFFGFQITREEQVLSTYYFLMEELTEN